MLLSSKNHSETEVVAADVNDVLRYIMEVRDGSTEPFVGLDSMKHQYNKIPSVEGSVDFLYGGAPCQAFSGANHSPVSMAVALTFTVC